MFNSEVYADRRRRLLEQMAVRGGHGIAVFLGNVDAAANYRGNDYKFRQDSNFLYYWGIDEPWFAAVLDLDTARECLYGNDVDIDDIIWMGPQPSVASKGAAIGCAATAPLAEFDKAVAAAVAAGRPVHFLPPARYYNQMKLSQLTGISTDAVRKVAPVAAGGASEELVRSVVAMRLVKEQCEIEELDKAAEIGYWMHTEARRGCKPGVLEQEIVGRMEGVTYSKGWGPSFTTILSQNGETLHNHSHPWTPASGGCRCREQYPLCVRLHTYISVQRKVHHHAARNLRHRGKCKRVCIQPDKTRHDILGCALCDCKASSGRSQGSGSCPWRCRGDAPVWHFRTFHASRPGT